METCAGKRGSKRSRPATGCGSGSELSLWCQALLHLHMALTRCGLLLCALSSGKAGRCHSVGRAAAATLDHQGHAVAEHAGAGVKPGWRTW